MMKIQDFIVAGFRFRLAMESSQSTWNNLAQYDSFRVDTHGDALFCLNVATEVYKAEGEVVPICNCGEEGNEPLLNAYTCERGWMFEMSITTHHPICAHLVISNDFSEGFLYVDKPEFAQFSINNSLMLMFAFATASSNTLEMHASVVVKDGIGHLFLGKSGTGKSTHSSLWLKHIPQTELLNDDNPIVKVESDGSVVVYGSPWSGKTPCYRNCSARIGSFVQIRQAPKNAIQRQSVTDAIISIYTSCSGMKWNREMADGLFDTLQKIISKVPCYLLDCLPDAEAAQLCSKAVEKTI